MHSCSCPLLGEAPGQKQWQHRMTVLIVLLQNADDAKATTVRFVLDHTQYRTGTWASLSTVAADVHMLHLLHLFPCLPLLEGSRFWHKAGVCSRKLIIFTC
jgi:hypothetical protein